MMHKHVIHRGLQGLLFGIAVQYIAAIIFSLYLRLGYLLLYPATFAERFGGEMNAVLLVTAVCGLIGMGIGVISAILHQYKQGNA